MAVTKNITPIKMTTNKDRHLQPHRLTACLGAMLCAGLLMLAVPRFIATNYTLYPNTAYRLTENILPLTVYENSIIDLTSALSWHKQADYWQSLGHFYTELLKSNPYIPEEQKQAHLKNAQAAILEGLALSPVDPYGWYQLALIDSQLKAPRLTIINALRLSFYAGRVEPELVIPRLFFSYDYYNDFSADMQKIWQKQITIAWLFKRPQLVRFVLLHPEAKQLVLNAFINAPDDAKQFISMLAAITNKK